MQIHRLAGRPVKPEWVLAYCHWSETADGFRKLTHEVLALQRPDSVMDEACRHLAAAYIRFRAIEEEEALYQDALKIWRQAAQVYEQALAAQLHCAVPVTYILRLREQLARTRAALDLFTPSCLGPRTASLE